MTKPANEKKSQASAVIGMVILGVLGLVRLHQSTERNRAKSQLPARAAAPSLSTSPSAPHRPRDGESGSGPQSSPQRVARLARLNVVAVDGTAELQALFLQLQLSDAQRRALGLSTLVTGSDLYATRVRIENTGTLPIRVDPSKIRMHYGSQAVSVFTIEHSSFLPATLLQPNHYLSGLVVYRATLEVGAAIRLRGEGTYSYDDRTILVTYGKGSG